MNDRFREAGSKHFRTIRRVQLRFFSKETLDLLAILELSSINTTQVRHRSHQCLEVCCGLRGIHAQLQKVSFLCLRLGFQESVPRACSLCTIPKIGWFSPEGAKCFFCETDSSSEYRWDILLSSSVLVSSEQICAFWSSETAWTQHIRQSASETQSCCQFQNFGW